MLLHCTGIHQDVVQEHEDENIKVPSQDIIDHVHELRRGIGNAEWHHQKLVQAPTRSECCLRDVLLSDWHLPVSRLQINLAEHLGATQTVQHLFW